MSVDNKRPTKIFKFRAGSTFDLEALHDDYLWFSSFDDLNDPYEGFTRYDADGVDEGLRIKFLTSLREEEPKPEISPSQEVQRQYIQMQLTGEDFAQWIDERAEHEHRQHFERYRKECSVFSFSLAGDSHKFPAPLNSMKMWAHYANGFRGYCVEFDYECLISSIQQLQNDGKNVGRSAVRYIEDGFLPKISLKSFMESQIHDLGETASIEILESMCAKDSGTWSYEREARLLGARAGKYKISPECINAIYLSSKMPAWMRSNIISCVRAKNTGIRIYDVALHSQEYKLGFGEIK